jgi:hypothetical protein
MCVSCASPGEVVELEQDFAPGMVAMDRPNFHFELISGFGA